MMPREHALPFDIAESQVGPHRSRASARTNEELVTPQRRSTPRTPDRDEWIEQVCAGFVCPRASNKAYYRVFLEVLWPRGHGIPGPHRTEAQLREAVDNYRRPLHKKRTAYKPYLDVFRRVRELMGEEGVIGIAKNGKSYQLQSLELGPKREPRVALSTKDWQALLRAYDYRCALCRRPLKDIAFDQDHKVPRVRGGGPEPRNWQPLCIECNNFKSMACRGCEMDCRTCGYAFPEKYAPLRLTADVIQSVRGAARKRGIDPNDLANDILADAARKLLRE